MKTVGWMLMASLAVVLAANKASWATAPSEGPCAADARRLCAGVKKGGGRIVKCLHAHESELSEPCKNHLTDWKPPPQGHFAACEGDAEKFCSGAKKGSGAKMKCLREHNDQLSSACRDALAEHKGGKKPDESGAKGAGKEKTPESK